MAEGGVVEMRILLIEDNAGFAQSIERAVRRIDGCELTWHKSRDAALAALTAEPFDVAILDRKIPTADDILDDHENHGWDVFQSIRREQPGMSVWFLTGTEDADFASDLNNGYARNEDIHACGRADTMYQVFWKRRMNDCIAAVQEFRNDVLITDRISLVYVGTALNLRREEQRLIRLFCRKYSGSTVDIQPLTSGLSGARVLRLTVRNTAGQPIVTSVAKLDTFAEIQSESEKYQAEITKLLPGSFPQLTGDLRVGASGFAALFYAVVGEEVTTLFDKICTDPSGAADATNNLRTAQEPWLGATVSSRMRVSSIRRQFIGDVALYDVREHLDSIDINLIEAQEIDVAMCVQHGDLHCANVLFDVRDNPMFIDYMETCHTFASVDPVVLELSTIFHTDAPSQTTWPSDTQAENWTEIGLFSTGTPFEDFLRTCRQWSLDVAASPQEVWAVGYGYALRQLKYQDTDKALARAIIRACIAALSGTKA